MVLEMILSANTSSKSAIDILRYMSRSAILLKIGLVSFVFFQFCNRQVHRDFLITLYISTYIFHQICPTYFGVLYTILRDNFVYLLKIVSFLRGYYRRCVIKDKIYFILYNT
jgi:hypothetical protein